jgi:histidine ammonia-lyase
VGWRDYMAVKLKKLVTGYPGVAQSITKNLFSALKVHEPYLTKKAITK